MPETAAPAVDFRDDADLISFLKANPIAVTAAGCAGLPESYSGAVFHEANAAQREHSFDVVRQQAKTPSN